MNKKGKIRVAQLINAFIPCGAENVARDIAIRLNGRQFESIVIAIRQVEGYKEQEYIFQKSLAQKGVRSHSLLKKPGSLSPLPFLRLVKILRKERVDILHIHGQLPQLLGLIAGFFCGFPRHIITLHTSGHWYETFVYRYILKDFLIPLCRPEIVSISSTIHQKWNFHPSRRRLVYNGIEIANLYLKKKDCKQNRKKVIGVIGRLTPAKGHQILFDAVARLLRNRDDFLVHVVGDGELKKGLMAMAQSFNLNGQVRFLGFRDDVRTLYPTFDMVVIPSLWEGLSITLLEAMASGLPVVATAVSGNIDAIENGRNGLLIPPNSARELAKGIEYILDHPENAASFGRRARQVVECKFTVQAMVKQYERLYSDVIKTED